MKQELINRGLILTDRGKQLLENAQVTQQDIVLTKFGVGEGAETPYSPTLEELKALTVVPGEWDKRSLEGATDLPDSGTEITGLIPHDVGEGKWLRIFGIYTENDDLIYVFLYPEWKKPTSGGNSFYEVPWKVTTGISDTDGFKLVVNPSIVTASQAFVLEQDKKHIDASHPHSQYQLAAPHFIAVDEPIKLGQLNVFMSHQDVLLPTAPDGSWFIAKVHQAVNLDTGECQYLPPVNEAILSSNKARPWARLVVINQEFRFVRINGVWCV